MTVHTFAPSAKIWVVLALTAVSISCTDGPLEPILPTWDVKITVPVMNRRYLAQEILPLVPPGGIPMKSLVVCDTAVIGDTTGDGTPDRILDQGTLQNLNAGTVYIEVTNGFPVEITLKAGLLDAAGRMLLPLPTGATDSIWVQPADTASGRVSRAKVSRSELVLTASDVRCLIPAERVRYAFLLEFPGGSTPPVNGADSLRIRMWSTVSYRVTP